MITSRRTVLSVAAIGVLSVAAPLASRAAPGPNLLPNHGFEQSVLEPAPVPPYTQPQPALPVGWVFEGVAGLFDHYPEATGGRTTHGGTRAVAISIPASTKPKLCADPPVGCHDNPINQPRDALRPYYSLTPHWRTLQPVPVTAGKSYTLSVWEQHEIVTEGEGATTRVRWLDANGLTISESIGPVLNAGLTAPDNSWRHIAKAVTAPAGAVRAHVLLGHTDDHWIGQVRYDDVYFGLTTA